MRIERAYFKKGVMNYHIIENSYLGKAADGQVHEMIFSTETKDRHGDIVRVSGAQLKNFKKNPVYLWAHNNYIPAIGRVKSIKKEPSQLVGRTVFDDEDEFAKLIESKFERGFLSASSIGFIPLEWEEMKDKDGWVIGYDIKKYDLLEVSAVPVPANFEALSKDMDFFKQQEWEKYIEEFGFPVPEGFTKNVVIYFDDKPINETSQKSIEKIEAKKDRVAEIGHSLKEIDSLSEEDKKELKNLKDIKPILAEIFFKNEMIALEESEKKLKKVEEDLEIINKLLKLRSTLS